MKTSNLIILVSILVLITYTIVCLVGWLMFKVEPPTVLTQCLFTFFGTELGMTMVIKVFKIKYTKGE